MAQQIAEAVIKKFSAGSKTTAGIGAAIVMLGGIFTAFASDTNSNFQEVRALVVSSEGSVSIDYQVLNADIKLMRSAHHKDFATLSEKINENKVLILTSEARVLNAIQESRQSIISGLGAQNLTANR